ncbi:MAG TPA: TMEM14 family protein [Clostridia bacterium]|nr:TMEM14 family protein [Clostridia bacterium]
MTATTILWIYIIMLVIGGLIGFFKAKSKVSLVMSVAFAAALSLCATGIIFKHYVADILLAALLILFTMRLVKTKKFMPAGMMLVLTLLALAMRNIRF